MILLLGLKQNADLLLDAISKLFVVNQNAILDGCILPHYRASVFVCKFFFEGQLENVVKLGDRHIPIVLFINLKYDAHHVIHFVVFEENFHKVSLGNGFQFALVRTVELTSVARLVHRVVGVGRSVLHAGH